MQVIKYRIEHDVEFLYRCMVIIHCEYHWAKNHVRFMTQLLYWWAKYGKLSAKQIDRVREILLSDFTYLLNLEGIK